MTIITTAPQNKCAQPVGAYTAKSIEHLAPGTFIVNHLWPGTPGSMDFEVAVIGEWRYPLVRFYVYESSFDTCERDCPWDTTPNYDYAVTPDHPLWNLITAVDMRVEMGIADEDQPDLDKLRCLLKEHMP